MNPNPIITRTGIRIGCAHIQRLRPEDSHGYSGPHRLPRRPFDRQDKIVMRGVGALAVVLGLVLLLGR
jgi:hypothetical protein